MKSMFFTMCLRSLVVRALERYSKDPGSSPGGDTCFSLQQKLLPVGGRPCKWLQKESLPRLALPNINLCSGII